MSEGFILPLQLNAVVELSAERWTDLIEQTTMLMMILGRWLLPTAQGMTKDSLSQLLLINLAMSADIIEFFDILKQDFVKSSGRLVVALLSLWTWSLMQFPFNTMSKLDPSGDRLKELTPVKTSQISPERSHEDNFAAFTTPAKTRVSMTSLDFKQAVAAKRISRDILLMSHNYSGGLPRDYLSRDQRGNIAQPKTGENTEVLRNNSFPGPIKDCVPSSNYVSLAKKQSSSQHREPRCLSLDVGQMRPKRFMGHMTTSLTSPSLRFELMEKQITEKGGQDSFKTVESPEVHRLNHETCTDGQTSEEKTKHSRITTELVAILMSLFMQDGPFLTFRILIIAQYQAYQYMIIFLTVKNALVLALQVYRLCVLHCTC